MASNNIMKFGKASGKNLRAFLTIQAGKFMKMGSQHHNEASTPNLYADMYSLGSQQLSHILVDKNGKLTFDRLDEKVR